MADLAGTPTYDKDITAVANSVLQLCTGTISLAGDYVTGGFSLDLRSKLGTVKQVFFEHDSAYLFNYDHTNRKVLIYNPLGSVTATGNASADHTHAITTPTGAGSSHTHTSPAISASGAASAAGSAHTHASGTIAASGAASGAPSATTTRIDCQCYPYVKGSANTDSENADTATEPTNHTTIVAEVTQTDVATALGVLTVAGQPDIPRNVCVCITNDSGGALNLYEGTTTFQINGTFRGVATQEEITFTSTAGNKSIDDSGADQYRVKYGVEPFDTITSVLQPGYATDAMAGGLKISVGFGSKIGLYNDLATPIEADVVKLTKNAADLSPSGIVGTTFSTVNFGALADDDDISLAYKTSAMPSTAHTHTAGAITVSGSVADESAHTHAAGAITVTKDANCGNEAAHTHAITTPTGGQSATHTHAVTASAGSEVANGTTITGITDLRFIAVGYLA